MQEPESKVSPEVAIFIQLDELNSRMGKLVEHLENMTARGQRFSNDISVTATPQRVAFEAISYSLVNDGPASVYTEDAPDPAVATRNELRITETESVDLKRRQKVEFYIRCAAGLTATVRLRRLI